MIKRQTDFEIRVRPFTENQPSQLPMLKAEFPSEDGWELLGTQVAQVGGNTISIMFTFARYEYEVEAQEEVPSGNGGTVTMVASNPNLKKRGRPPKVQPVAVEEEVVA